MAIPKPESFERKGSFLTSLSGQPGFPAEGTREA
jgi:hypothetical protein